MKPSTPSHSHEINVRDFDNVEALYSAILPRSFVIAIIFGSLLNLVNQYEMIFGSEAIRILPLILTYITPFVVVMFSQRMATGRAWSDFSEGLVPNTKSSFLAVAFSHGIPPRALILGVFVGSLNTAILLLGAYLHAGEFTMIPHTQIGQFYLIPMLVGLLSQALSYRRAITNFKTE